MNETPGSFELREPVSPEILVPDSWAEPWMFAVGFSLLAILLMLVYFKRKRLVPVDPRAIREMAHTQAVELLANMEPSSARDAALQASLILRRYLSSATGDPALFETHEETIARHEALKEFSDETKAAVGQGFSHLAAMKYAHDIPDVPPVEVLEESRALLETLHHGFRE